LLATDYQGRIEFAKPWGSTAMRKPMSLLRRLFHDKCGLSAVTVAVSLPVLFGVAGLGIDTGLWYTIKRQNQSAADAAALSAAYEVIAGNTNVATNLTPAASEAATRNNYGGTTPVVTYPYNDAVVTGGVKVTLSQTQNAWFSSWFPAFTNFTIANEAVAAVNSLPPVCMLVLGLNPPPSGSQNVSNAVNLAGNPTINAPTCTIVSDSDSSSAFYVQGSATINAATLITPGEISHTGAAYTINLSYPAQTGANVVTDPYASTLTHANFLTNGLSTALLCTSLTSGGITTYSNPGGYKPGCVIAGGLSIKNSTVNLSPGTYWLTGDLNLQSGSGAVLQCTACTNGGAGVTIILTAPPGGGTVGTMSLASNANLNLNAPAASSCSNCPFAGMVLIQDSNGLPAADHLPNPDTVSAQANSTETLSGLVYFPQADVTFQGTPAASGPQCLVLVTNTLSMQGNPGFATSGCGSLGLNKLPIVKTVYLAE
jgi:Flp pilus assembly protein TadG